MRKKISFGPQPLKQIHTYISEMIIETYNALQEALEMLLKIRTLVCIHSILDEKLILKMDYLQH